MDMSLVYALAPTTTEYTRLKTTLKKSTAAYGAMLSASYFITQGSDQGVSAAVGAAASYAYMSLLSKRVDTFEKSAFQTEFLAPLGAAAFEMAWNDAPFAFDFDYGATFVGFLAYKFALSTVLYQTVRDMMLESSDS
jgi:drug/metabolite transporter (DMT)-like permease